MISQSIRQHITRLGRTEPFTTKDFLTYGPRSSVDQALSRLVKMGYIVRLAPGVFARENDKDYSQLEISSLKVKSRIMKAIKKLEKQTEFQEEKSSDTLNSCVNEFRRLSSNIQMLITQAS